MKKLRISFEVEIKTVTEQGVFDRLMEGKQECNELCEHCPFNIKDECYFVHYITPHCDITEVTE